MLNALKAFAVWVFWLPTLCRCLSRFVEGRFFVFRDESNAFLRYMQWLGEDERDDEAAEFVAAAMDEIAARQRMGTWE